METLLRSDILLRFILKFYSIVIFAYHKAEMFLTNSN